VFLVAADGCRIDLSGPRGDKADATVRILGIAMVLAVVRSAMTPSAARDKSGAAPSHW
jgi:hypothetical protein